MVPSAFPDRQAKGVALGRGPLPNGQGEARVHHTAHHKLGVQEVKSMPDLDTLAVGVLPKGLFEFFLWS